MRSQLIGVVLSVSVIVSGCATSSTRSRPAQTPSSRPRSVNLAGSDLDSLVAGNAEFAFDLYRELRTENGNLLFSPHSLSAALAMAYAGARGETETQMADVLHFTLPKERVHDAFYVLDAKLVQRAEPGRALYDAGFELHVANSLWAQVGLPLRPEYVAILSESYGTEAYEVDFARRTEAARVAINTWVEQETRGRIPDIVPRGLLTPQDVLALINAIYFEAPWQHKFKDENTRDGKFKLLDGRSVEVPMMSHRAPFRYGNFRGVEAIELPYDGEETAMVILMPERGKFRSFEESLDTSTLESILDSMGDADVHLRMPRFRYDSTFILNKVLSRMGMSAAFAGADFSGIWEGRSYPMAFVIHKADIDVNEQGTVAAAGTVIGFRGASPAYVEMNIDHPFAFCIRDLKTGAILFLGRVLDPSG
jgi:serpin B